MTQQRPKETDEEYEKRKRRVKLTMMGGLAHGGGSIIAAAAIYYQDNGGNFLYIPDGSGNLVLDNKGSLGPTYDGLLYSGRGIELGATNDVTVGDAAKWTTWFDFADATHKTVFGVKTFNSITTNSILVSASEPSALTLAKFNNNPNLVGKLALSGTGTIPEVDLTLVASDEYYMCSEKEGAYLVDSRNIGSELVINGTFDTDISSWLLTGTPTFTWSSGKGAYTRNAFGDRVYQAITCVVGVTYKVSISLSNITGGAARVGFNQAITSSTEVANTTTNGEYIVVLPATATTMYIIIDTNANLATVDIDNISIYEATATEIANYADTVRTNADLQQKGIQTTAFVTDGAGVPTAFTSNILNFTSLDYIDTQWNPSLETEFWLEEVIDGVVYQHNYDGVNLTTYTDNVAGAPAAHSPENASYLLGKGVYPKVTANPYTSYQAKTFAVYTGSRYASYDQSARYTILAAL